MESKSQDSIQVCIRIRPDKDDQAIVQFTDKQIHLDKNHFGFDQIFPPSSTQDDIFAAVGHKVIAHTLDGYNGCTFVYGQTGSGKTYTMMGDNDGLMQKSFIKLFSEIQSRHGSQCIISCSYYEIYNQQIIDLLDVKKDKKLCIRQDVKKGVFVENLNEQTVYSSNKLLQFLSIGMKNRHVGQTMMNRESSRSHSIFTISLSIQTQMNGHKVLKTPKLHFVDLAGSQRQKMTSATGDRLKEASNINKSLTALGIVINALTSQKIRSHIPYRDSKLTSLLRDSLGGNSKTFLIATISRSITCFQQTLSTLNFANRAKMVKVKALINEQSLSNNIQVFKQQIRRLKTQICKLKSQNKPTPTPQINWLPRPSTTPDNINYDNHFKQINDKISVISEHIAKNNMSPSFQQLIQQIKKNQPIVKSIQSDDAMIDQEQELSGVNQDPQATLITYLSSNNCLLEKIHEKIQEYLQLKQQLHNKAYHDQMIIKQLKTPSKFERDQYEQMIQQRNLQIQALQQELSTLKNVILDKDIHISQLQQQKIWQSQQKDQTVINFHTKELEYTKEIYTLKNIINQQNQQIQTNCKKIQENATQLKQTKQLYMYAEQNYDTQKQLRLQIQKNLYTKMQQMQEQEKSYENKVQETRQYYEQLQETIKQENNILSQTLEFKQKLLSQSLQSVKQWQQKYNELHESYVDNKKLYDHANVNIMNIQLMLENVQKQYGYYQMDMETERRKYSLEAHDANQRIQVLEADKKNMMGDMEEKIGRLQECLKLRDTEIREISDSYDSMLTQKNQTIKKIEDDRNQMESNKDSIIKNAEQKLNQYIQQVNNLYQTNNELQIRNIELQNKINEQSLYHQKLQKQLKNFQAEFQEEKQKLIDTYQQERKVMLENNQKMFIEVQELRKTHKQLIRENYRIKNRNSPNGQKQQEELLSKVSYYQQKFKLMSAEYQKAVQIVNKSKQKQLKLLQKIAFLEQNTKVNANNSEHSLNSQIQFSQICTENRQLKNQLQKLKAALKKQNIEAYSKKMGNNNNTNDILLQEKQQYFRDKIIGSISRWAPGKQNVELKNRTLEELIKNWQEIQSESVKHLQAITKGIKKQQKLKMQNNVIVKQNLYLKEQISNMQKEMAQYGCAPRKLVKIQ